MNAVLPLWEVPANLIRTVRRLKNIAGFPARGAHVKAADAQRLLPGDESLRANGKAQGEGHKLLHDSACSSYRIERRFLCRREVKIGVLSCEL